MFSITKSDLWPKEFSLILGTGLLIRLVTAYFNEGFVHPDEQFQILEFLHKIRGGQNVTLTWEWTEQMRPLTQVYFYKYLLAPFEVLFSTFAQAFILRLSHVFLGTLTFLFFAREFFRFAKLDSQYHRLFYLYWAFTGLFPYFLVRTSSESLGSIIFFWVLGLMFQLISRFSWKTAFLFGISVGLCFNVRFQNAFAIAGLLAWGLLFHLGTLKRSFFPLLMGYLLVTAVSVILDRMGFGNWVFTPYQYFEQNILEDKASNFGVSYWAHYFEFGMMVNFPVSALIFVPWLFYVVKNFRSPISWATVAFFVAHSCVGHKEYRFISMIFWLAPVYLVFWHAHLFKTRPHPEKWWLRVYFFFSSLYLLGHAFFPVRSEIPFLKKMLKVVKSDQTIFLMDHANDPSSLGTYRLNFYAPEKFPLATYNSGSETPQPNSLYFADGEFDRKAPFSNCQILVESPGPILRMIFRQFPSLPKKTKYRSKYLWKCGD
jgi:phosphatidylinositol glycan class B